MNKKKRILIGSITAVLAGVGIYKWVSGQQKNRDSVHEPWTVADMPDLHGKVMIVTGANSGLGFETAKALAGQGAETILACRNMDKARAALTQLQAEIPGAPAEIMELDLASLASVRRFAEAFKAKYGRLDVLVNNAGIMMTPYDTTEDGFERQFGTNHLGHFALTGHLIDLLLETPGARVVNVSSTGHRFGTMDFDNLLYEGGAGYSPLGAYGRSKLANLLFTYELQRRFEAMGAEAIAVAAHPGIAETNLAAHIQDRWYLRWSRPLTSWMLQSAAMGALPSIRAAVDPDVSGGQFYGPGGPRESRGYPVVVESSEAAHDEPDARRLWQVSEELTGVRYL